MSSKFFIIAVTKFFVLLVFWLLLSGRVNPADAGDLYLLTCGLVSCALVTYLTVRSEILDEEAHPINLPFRLLAYIPWLLWEILLANLDVAYRVWHPKRKISPRVVVVPFRVRSTFGAVTYANSITLTPGTITIGVDMAKRQMLVHALTAKAARGLFSGEMDERVCRLEGSL